MTKKTIIGAFIFLFGFCQFAFCQYEILKMNYWTEKFSYFYEDELPMCSLTTYEIWGDTLINNVEYKKIYSYGNVKGAVRETKDSLVYFYDVRYNREVLLYDFAWVVGKQIKSANFEEWDGESEVIPEYVYATIEKIDTLVMNNGKKLPYITTSLGTKCIQGIGDTEGFIRHLDLARPDCECGYNLWCAIDMRINDLAGVLYKDKNCIDCAVCNNKELAILETYNVFSFSQNPVKDKLTLTFPYANNEIKIFNLQGKLLLQQNVGQTAEVNVSMLQTGTYVLMINNSESLTFLKN